MSSKRKQMPTNMAGNAARVATPFAARREEITSPAEQAARRMARVRKVSVFRLEPHPLQPAVRHSTENVAELKSSISKLGLLEPPLVWRKPDGSYVILAGHRRWHACKLLVAEEGYEERIHVYALEHISEAEALQIVAAEYCHRKEYSVLHMARIVGAAHETLRTDRNAAVPLRDLAAVLPLGRSSLGHYLAISEAMQDPRLAPLVHSVDRPSKTLLYKALSHADIRAKIAALETMQRKDRIAGTGNAPAQRVRRSTSVRRRKRGKGFDLTVEVRPTMSPEDANRVRRALQEALRVVSELFPTA